jgi:hypothetical protein
MKRASLNIVKGDVRYIGASPFYLTCKKRIPTDYSPQDSHCANAPLPQAIHVSPPSTSTRPPSEHAATTDLDPTSLRARRHCPLPQALDTASGEGDTAPLPHVTVCANVSEFD